MHSNYIAEKDTVHLHVYRVIFGKMVETSANIIIYQSTITSTEDILFKNVCIMVLNLFRPQCNDDNYNRSKRLGFSISRLVIQHRLLFANRSLREYHPNHELFITTNAEPK